MNRGFCLEKLEKRALARLGVNGKKILKRALKIRIGRLWTRLMLLSTRIDGKLLTVFSRTKFLGVIYLELVTYLLTYLLTYSMVQSPS